MRRRSRASSKLANARSRKAKTLKAARHSSSSASGQETEVARLTRELHEAQEQQAASAEVLKIISTSPTELQPVLEVVARSAARFCEADDVTIFELDGQYLRIAAHWGTLPQEVGVRFPCVRGQVAGRAVLERKPIHVIDLQAEAEEFPEGSAFARRLGHRTIVGVPLLREGVAVGTIMLRRAELNPFTNKQITLLETFAAQAVIAIENTRLLNELRQRTTDLTESLEQQTATSEVLSVISSSAGELEPIFQAMLENAVRICDATFGNIYRWDGNALRLVAAHNTPPALAEARRRSPLTAKDPVIARMLEIKTTIHVDAATHQGNVDRSDPGAVTALELGGVRTVLAVPMLKENELIGSFTVYRQEPRPFTEKQISLVTNFAAQAVIAIENTRLLNELRQSLQQQTATSDVLGVISKSPGELKPVFDAVLENATRLCEANFGTLYRFENDAFSVSAFRNAPPEFAAFQQGGPLRPSPASTLGRAAKSRKPTHVVDITAEPGYLQGDPYVVEATRTSGARTVLVVPMLKESELVGAIAIYRTEVRPFTDKQIELVQNFAVTRRA